MKKFLTALLLSVVCLTAAAQTQWYRATEFAYKYVNDYGYWTAWSAWQPSDVSISIDLDEDIVTIYSKSKQVYYVYNYDGWTYDTGGGKYIQYSVIDQDRDYGKIRLRVESNGNSQLYVDFANCSWVYNVRRTS